ncbi:MAG TPA: hypothetical protein DD473_19995 [Planctomycetaceae bacterium]|nr:hypothetical protein [Planctomycetaceae bacterium]|tara:strand:- start:443 stop:715 length:273 start_codon:yes stop_codon:yes gene_type:complete
MQFIKASFVVFALFFQANPRYIIIKSALINKTSCSADRDISLGKKRIGTRALQSRNEFIRYNRDNRHITIETLMQICLTSLIGQAWGGGS